MDAVAEAGNNWSLMYIFAHCLHGVPAVRAGYQTVRSLLNYNYGTLRSWRELVQQARPFSTCDFGIMSGKYDSGRAPSTSMFPVMAVPPPVSASTKPVHPRPEDVVYELWQVELHDGDVLPPLITTVICGDPEPKAGLVIDSFRLVQPKDLVEYES